MSLVLEAYAANSKPPERMLEVTVIVFAQDNAEHS
jgi:hypothetical protein